MKRLIFLLSALALILALVPAGMTQAKKPAPKLDCTIDYWWVRLNPPDPFPGRWEGTVSGDIEGDIVWPGGGEMKFAGQTSHYGGGLSFEIRDKVTGELLLVGGDSIGSTTVRHGKNSVWRSSGTIAEAYEPYEDWKGRRVYQDGHFTWAAPGVPEAGSGRMRVN